MKRKIELATYSLERICIDYGIECIFQSASKWVNLRFTAAQFSDGEMVDINQTESVTRLVRMLHVELKELYVNDDSILQVDFENRDGFRVFPVDEFESWELVTSENLRWVCMPGGEVAIWS